MKPVIALLGRTGVRLIIYLDDLLFMNSSKVELQQDMATAQYLLERESRFCDKPREIAFSVGVSRISCEYSGYDSAPASLQGRIDQVPLFEDAITSRSFSTGAPQPMGKLTASIQAVFPPCIIGTCRI